jgi:hypothetical protein
MEDIIQKTQEFVEMYPCAIIRVDLGIWNDNTNSASYDLPDDIFHRLYTYLHSIRLTGMFSSWEHEELYRFQNQVTCLVCSNKNVTGPKGYQYTCYRYIEVYNVCIRSKKSCGVFRYQIFTKQIVPAYLQTDVYVYMECRMHHKLTHATESVNVKHHFYVKWKGKSHSECEHTSSIFNMYLEITPPILHVRESICNLWSKMLDLEGHPNEDVLFSVHA